MEKKLLLKKILVVNGVELDIVEVERYWHCEAHPDPTVHQHPLQKESGIIYFHRAARTMESKYRGGTRKGMDLAFGREDEYYSILVRSVRDRDTQEVVSGPCRVVNYILELCRKEHLEDVCPLTDTISLYSRDSIIHLRNKDEDEPIIYRGPRVGLPDTEWGRKKYRFSTSRKVVKPSGLN